MPAGSEIRPYQSEPVANKAVRGLLPQGELANGRERPFYIVARATPPAVGSNLGSDWLYEQIAATGRLELILSKKLDMPDEFWVRLRAEKDHELRAALICLLTAALAPQGTATIVGERAGGWFWLPQWSLWQPWAKQGLESAAKKMALKGYSLHWSKPLSEADSA